MKEPDYDCGLIAPGFRESATTVSRNIRKCSLQLAACVVMFASLCLATGCASKGNLAPDENAEDLSRFSDPRARRLLRTGDIQGASDAYSALATRAKTIEDQQDFLLVAAEILYDRGMTQPGVQKLALIPEQLVNSELQHRRAIIVSNDLLSSGNAELALEQLPDPNTVESALHRARTYELRAKSYRQLQNPDEELLARIELEKQLARPGIVRANHQQIWQMLTTQPVTTLSQMTTNVRGDIYQGWIELALANAGAGTEARQRAVNIENWKSRFPGHPAQDTLMSTLYNAQQYSAFTLSSSGPIRQVAVLLPLSAEGIGAAAEAIRDGLVVAYQNSADPLQAPNIRFYDIGDNVDYVRTAFQNAVNDGADAVIGPLRKEAVTAIVTMRNIPVPVLTLNYVDTMQTGTSGNVLQFGLAPEDEARSAALRALALDYRNAIVLQTDDSRGDREARAFSEMMLLNGGDVVHNAILPADEYDYSKQIKDALLITQSDQRFRQMSRAIDQKLFFEPSIRGDVDVVFLALTHEQARSVRPQLAFFRAGKVPMLATARVAAIDDDVKANSDLNGIHYADTPWELDRKVKSDPVYKQVASNFPDGMEVFSKLYALGIDAWSIVTNLDNISNGQVEELSGYTGTLSIGPGGRVQRRLLWAKYDEGKVKTIPNVEYKAPVISQGASN